MSGSATARAAVVAMRCRAGAPGGPVAAGVDALAAAIGDLTGVPPRPIGSFAAPPARYGEDLEVSRGCLLEAGGQVQDALTGDARPVLVAGDGAIALTTLPAVAQLRADARYLWLSPSACFHTPQTTPDGALAGMALAGACGRWGTGFQGSVAASQVVLCGVGELHAAEREAIAAAGATVIGASLETLVYLQNVLDGGAVYVHVDVGLVAGGEPATSGEGGAPRPQERLSDEKLFDLLDAVADSCEVLGVEVTGVGAAGVGDDVHARAELIAALLVPVLP